MKSIFLVLATTLTVQMAQASWLQLYCSNAEATVKILEGDSHNKVDLIARVVNLQGDKIETPVEFHLSDLAITVEKEIHIESKYESDCQPGSSQNSGRATVVLVRDLKIKRADGNAFKQDFVGLDENKQNISATVICEQISTWTGIGSCLIKP